MTYEDLKDYQNLKAAIPNISNHPIAARTLSKHKPVTPTKETPKSTQMGNETSISDSSSMTVTFSSEASSSVIAPAAIPNTSDHPIAAQTPSKPVTSTKQLTEIDNETTATNSPSMTVTFSSEKSLTKRDSLMPKDPLLQINPMTNLTRGSPMTKELSLPINKPMADSTTRRDISQQSESKLCADKAVHHCVWDCPCKNCSFDKEYKCKNCGCPYDDCSNQNSLDDLYQTYRSAVETINDSVWRKLNLPFKEFKKAFEKESKKNKNERGYKLISVPGSGLCFFHSIS